MPGFAVIYRWRLKAGMEAQFVRAWSRITELYVAHRRGLGSRLHKDPTAFGLRMRNGPVPKQE